MKGRTATYSFLIKSAWFAMAMFLVIFFGPFKRLVELRAENVNIATSSQVLDKNPKTSHREKREIAKLVHAATHQSPDAGLVLFLFTAFLLSLSLRRGNRLKLQYSPVTIVPALPRYLHFRRLQV